MIYCNHFILIVKPFFLLSISGALSFMGCSINALTPDQTNQKLPNGLVQGHAYSITGMHEVELYTARVKGKIPLVR